MNALLLAAALFAQTPATTTTTPPPVRQIEVVIYPQAGGKVEAAAVLIPLDGALDDATVWRIATLVKKLILDLQ